MRFCQFKLKIPKGSDWAIRGEFDEAHCCGKPAVGFITSAKGFDYHLCAEHFDQMDTFFVQEKFAGFGDKHVGYTPCGSND